MGIEDLLRIGIARIVLNYTGAIVRWTYGSIWRTLFDKPKFAFNEYVHGPKESTDSFDTIGHKVNNKIIGGIFIVAIIYILIKLV